MDRKEEGTPVVIALPDSQGSYTAALTTLRGWFDIERGEFVIPFESATQFAVSMIQLIGEIKKAEETAQDYWEKNNG